MDAAGRRRTERVLAGLALVAGAAVPVQLVTLSFGYAQYVRGVPKGPGVIPLAHDFARVYLPLVWLPALVVVATVAVYARRRHPGISRRIVVGAAAGAVATLGLDAIRQMGVIHGWLPADTAVMFGGVATGSSSFALLWPAGLAVHYANGASFGLFYAFVWGKRGSVRRAAAWATGWALVLELGMMVLPPMGPMTGLFGSQFAWPGLFLITLAAHVVFGLALGPLVEVRLTDADRGSLVPFILGRRAPQAAAEGTSAPASKVAGVRTVDVRESPGPGAQTDASPGRPRTP